jgi:rubrerythrin
MKIRSDIVTAIQGGGLDQVRRFLQAAVELEHATIPAYQTALFSIKPGSNREAAAVIASVAREEMLHMAIACNVLNALGGAPVIDKPDFIPVFPGPLPMGIGDLTVGLEKLTRGLVYNTFMAIEQPEAKLDIAVKAPRLAPLMALCAPAPTGAAAPAAAEYATIGDFYHALMKEIAALPTSAFGQPSSPQVVDNTWYPPAQLFPITDAASAIRALEVIVDQGEGTKTDPLEAKHGAPAHYYRFAEIAYARRLVRDQTEPNGFAYSGAPVPLDPAGVWNLLSNAKAVDYAEGTQARHLAERFNYSYTCLLKALHETFNGRPETLKSALALMFEVRLLGGNLAATPVEGTPYNAAPTYEYTPLPLS